MSSENEYGGVVMLSVRLFQIVIANKCYECLTVSGEEGGRIGGREVERGWGRVGGSSGRAGSTWRLSLLQR